MRVTSKNTVNGALGKGADCALAAGIAAGVLAGLNCGTGAGGFQPGNACAKGGGDGGDLPAPGPEWIPVYRGVSERGLQRELRTTEGINGDVGVFFYRRPQDASAYAGPRGGIITGYVHPDDVSQKGGGVVILRDPTKFDRRGTVPTEETRDFSKIEAIAQKALKTKDGADGPLLHVEAKQVAAPADVVSGSVAKSFAKAGADTDLHNAKVRALVNQLPDGTKIGGWEKVTIGKDVFWQKGGKGVVDVLTEAGSKKVGKAVGHDVYNPPPIGTPIKTKLAAIVTAAAVAALYRADQSRDDHGRFAEEGGAGTGEDELRAMGDSAAIDRMARGDKARGDVTRQIADKSRSSNIAADAAAHGTPGTSVRPPASPADVPRFLDDVKRTYEYQEVNRRLDLYKARSPSGDVTKWSTEQNTGPDGKFTPARQKLHDAIVAETLTPASVAAPGTRPQAMLLLGPPGSGKSTAGAPYAKKLGVNFAVINPDDVKAKLPEYRGWNAALLHDESSVLSEGRILAGALAGRHHVLLDATGKNAGKYDDIATELGKAGYDVHVVHVATPPHVSVGRAWSRFAKDGLAGKGRFVPVDYAYRDVDHKPDITYRRLKDNPAVKSWASIDTQGAAPAVLESGKR